MFMNKQQFQDKISKLKDRGYCLVARYTHFRGDGQDYLYKPLIYRKDEYEHNRAVCQLLFKIWHLEEFKDKLLDIDSIYSLEPVISISRNIDERLELHIYSMESIEKCEDLSIKFLKFVDDEL